MKLVIVRHGDPDYVKDSLTETGWQEAQLLVDRIVALNADEYYVSPLGRAKDTSSFTMEKLGKTPIVLDWLREFEPRIKRPDLNGGRSISWDWLPEDWMTRPEFYNPEKWYDEPEMEEANVKEEYKKVCQKFDEFLEQHGYKRDGNYYKAVKPNNDTIVFFCHFGLECLLLSHILKVSPMILWHGFCAAPTSVTTIYTEERREGIASLRVASFGDVSHLYANGKEPSFAGRFCECFTNQDERHD